MIQDVRGSFPQIPTDAAGFAGQSQMHFSGYRQVTTEDEEEGWFKLFYRFMV